LKGDCGVENANLQIILNRGKGEQNVVIFHEKAKPAKN